MRWLKALTTLKDTHSETWMNLVDIGQINHLREKLHFFPVTERLGPAMQLFIHFSITDYSCGQS